MAVFAIALCPVGTAIAAPPVVIITSPFNGGVVTTQTPTFGGFAEEGHELTLRIYSGPAAEGVAIEEGTFVPPGGAWSIYLFEHLRDGIYTAVAIETNAAGETGRSPPVTFTVSTGAPAVTLNAPNSPPYDTTPSFTGTATDTQPVTVLIHVGPTAKGLTWDHHHPRFDVDEACLGIGAEVLLRTAKRLLEGGA